MEREIYLFTGNGKKRPHCNSSKNASSPNKLLRYEKIKKSETNFFCENGIRCNYQEIHANIPKTLQHTKQVYEIPNKKANGSQSNSFHYLGSREDFDFQMIVSPKIKSDEKESESENSHLKYTSSDEVQVVKQSRLTQKFPFDFNQFGKEFIQYYSPATLFPIYNQLVMLLSNSFHKQKNQTIISYLGELTILKTLPKFPFCSQGVINQIFGYSFPQSMVHSISLDSSLTEYTIMQNLVPSCNECLIPGFHSVTAWLLPPSFFEKGGSLRINNGFLKGLPVNLSSVCFLIKNIITVESSYLFVSHAKKEEIEYFQRENFSLKEESCRESIFYFDELNSKDVTRNNELLIERNNFPQYNFSNINSKMQSSIFCGFVCIENQMKKSQEIQLKHNNKNIVIEYFADSKLLLIGSCTFPNSITTMYINGKKQPHSLSDCDIFLKRDHSFESQLGKNSQKSKYEPKVPLLIPRLKCVIKRNRNIDLSYTTNKPCYLLLWNYHVRNFKNTTGDINWIHIQCKFFPLKYFGRAYEASVPINLKPHQEVILDQLNRIRSIEEARIFAWILAGCMQYTVNELLVDSFTKSLYLSSKCDINNEINIFNNCIQHGPFIGFPEPPLDKSGKIRWNILNELVEG
ncbi:hypothetical protein HWI79_185 [Cryptosporidium felis]|nr:hypothetical protein HWI79_185 [Cryptosporidium felis]